MDKPENECIELQCQNLADTGGRGGLRCKQCWLTRRVTREKQQRHERKADPNKRKFHECVTEGCVGEAEVGGNYGRYCRDCGLVRQADKRAAKKARVS